MNIITISELNKLNPKEVTEYLKLYNLDYNPKDNSKIRYSKLYKFIDGNTKPFDSKPAKLASLKKDTSAKVKETISLSQVGRNMNIIIDNKHYTKVIAEADIRDNIKNLILAFNKNQDQKTKTSLLKMFTANSTVIKEKIETIKKSIDKKVDLSNLAMSDLISKLPNSPEKTALFAKYKEISEVKKSKPDSNVKTKRTGEY